MRIRESRIARSDIDMLYLQGVQNFGEAAAISYVEGLLNLFQLLALHPDMARERFDVKPPVRIQPYEAHLVVYRVKDGELLISRVLHARSNWADQSFPSA